MTAGLSVVLPAYDEAEHLAGNLRRLLACLDAGGRSFEVIVVDDGSRDATGDVARAVAARDPRVRVLAHDRNRGKGRALATGCGAAREALVVLLDADLEIPPEDVLPLVERLEREQADVAVGSKYHPEASLVWPAGRRALSRLYHLVTAVCFRLPLRDTQTGLKVLRREVAADLVPRLRARRFAWDLELVLLAHRDGRRCVTGPVHVRPADRASRVRWQGALQAGLDTLRIFARDRGLAAYGPARPTRARRTRLLVSGDDLGLCASVDAGLLRGLETGGLRSVSVLVTGPRAAQAAADLRTRAPGADAGLHLDLLAGGGALGYAVRSLRQGAPAVAGALHAQLAAARAWGLSPSHVDAHRHAWALPWVRRAACRTLAAAGVGAVRALRPLGPPRTWGLAEGPKRLVLTALACASAGSARARGLAAPDGWVDAREAARWVRAGALPRWVRGRCVEVVAHPALGVAGDVPPGERGTLDRHAEARAVLEPPLARALEWLGAEVIGFRDLAARRPRR